MHEDGEMTLRANQADMKYKAMAQKSQLSKEERDRGVHGRRGQRTASAGAWRRRWQ